MPSKTQDKQEGNINWGKQMRNTWEQFQGRATDKTQVQDIYTVTVIIIIIGSSDSVNAQNVYEIF